MLARTLAPAALALALLPAVVSAEGPTEESEFSPFYDAELEARAARLDLMTAGAELPVPPFGPLQ